MMVAGRAQCATPEAAGFRFCFSIANRRAWAAVTKVEWVVLAYAGITSILWLRAAVVVAWRVRRVGLFEQQPAPALDVWPKLSVVIAARDEAVTLPAAMHSLRQQDYPALEIIIVDDRSVDQTGEVIDELVKKDPRIKAEHVRVLPKSWLGKVHALACATRVATGDWLLFTDADVHHRPGLLREAVAMAMHGGFDHVALIPDLMSRSLWVNTAVAAFSVSLLERVPPPAQHDLEAPTIGVGGFNLVRRAVFDRTPGFAWLSLEIADDFALAQMLRAHGARTVAMFTRGAVKVEWYPTLRAFFRGLNKNVFGTLTRFSYPRAALSFVALTALFLGPFVGLVAPGAAATKLASAATIACVCMIGVAVAAALGWRRLPFLLLPIGLALLIATIFTSAWSCWRQGGVAWRDTVYPVALLKAAQRVRL